MALIWSDSAVTKRPGIPGAARAEAAGLRWLREASQAVLEVLDVTDAQLTIARIDAASPTPHAARRAGVELARIHAAGAASWGCPPPGWEGPNFIGTQRQDCVPTDDWATFYTEQRVLPFARAARLPAQLRDLVEDACAALVADAQARAGWGSQPARIHGDLWAGNLLFSTEGPAFIDPAAHGGHLETDLAMLDLFGAPFIEDIRAGYTETQPLAEGWRERTPIHQLHPLAVHALTHGPGYNGPLGRAAQATLEYLS